MRLPESITRQFRDLDRSIIGCYIWENSFLANGGLKNKVSLGYCISTTFYTIWVNDLLTKKDVEYLHENIHEFTYTLFCSEKDLEYNLSIGFRPLEYRLIDNEGHGYLFDRYIIKHLVDTSGLLDSIKVFRTIVEYFPELEEYFEGDELVITFNGGYFKNERNCLCMTNMDSIVFLCLLCEKAGLIAA